MTTSKDLTPTQDQDAGDAKSRRQNARLIAAAAALGAFGLAMAWLSWAARDTGDVFRGVRAGAVALGGLSRDEAMERLAADLPAAGRDMRLVDPTDGREWRADPADYGLAVDAESLADAAWWVGRDGGALRGLVARWSAAARGHDVLAGGRLMDVAAARAALADLAAEVDTSPRDATIGLVDGELRIETPVLGHQLDVERTLANLAAWSADPVSDTVAIAVVETSPRVYDLSTVALAYRRIVSGPVHLVWQDGISRTLSVDDVRRLVTIEPVKNPEGGTTPSIVFDNAAIARWLAPLEPAVTRPPRDARFDRHPVTGTVTVRTPSQDGVSLDVAETVQRVMDAAYTTERTTSPALVFTSPRVRTEALREVRDLEELARASTSLKGSSAGVLQNVLLASEKIQGVVVPTDAPFSFSAAVGAIDAAGGYDMATIDGAALASPSGAAAIGGGIAQLATTVFRAALWAGLPIVERHANPFRIGWVEPPVGLDAAVGGTGRDLRFTNDTEGLLLVQSQIDLSRRALTVVLYGVPDGRRVTVEGPAVTEVTPARPPVVRPDPRLAGGERVQVGWAREGATAAADRVVRRADGAEARDAWRSSYEAAADVFLVGR